MSCVYEDDVIARLLDGDVAQADQADLEAHVRTCTWCRRTLARSRHLDAAVATSSTHAADAETADRLLTQVIARATPPVVAGRTLQRRRILGAAAAGFVVGLLAMYMLSGRTATHDATAPRDVSVEAAPVDRTPAWRDPEMLLLPDHSEQSSTSQDLPTPDNDLGGLGGARVAVAAPTRLDVRRCVALLEDPELSQAFALQANARALAFGWPRATSAAIAGAVTTTRIAAGRVLIDASSPAALLAVARSAAPDDDVARALVAAASAHRGFRQRLRTALHDTCDASLCTLAVQLGDPDLDRRAIARVRREPALAERVAAACAAPLCQVERVGFLLDLWAELSRIGDDGSSPDEPARAAAWFRALPKSATVVLTQTLQNTRNVEVRERVFLALAARADVAALTLLLAWIDAPSVSIAHFAAYALSRLPAAVAPRLEDAARTSRRPELIWAALASQSGAQMQARLLAAGLPAEAVALLTAGDLRPPQIAAVASLLRGRNFVLVSKP